MDREEKIFADGFSFKRNENAPEFVVGRLSMKVDDAVKFIKDNQKNGWINFDIKKARTGNFYVELDTYTPKGGESSTEAKRMTNKTQSQNKSNSSFQMTDDEDDVPF
jgi:hypothetical protein